MLNFKIKGGARIGSTNIGWPFASLEIKHNKLILSTALAGTFSFEKNDITTLEPFRGLFSKGIKINHKVPSYNPNIVFWTFKSPTQLIELIKQSEVYNFSFGKNEKESDHYTHNYNQNGFIFKNRLF